MSTFTIQYLEPGPHIADVTAQDARTRLREAMERLPLSMVLLGWNLPEALVDACAEECQRAGAKLYRWHPLLTGNGVLTPIPAWQCINRHGDPIPGHLGMPEFTFMCPNRPEVREAILAHLRDLLKDDRYQGVFLDRMRYPSPAADPENALGCFCEDCQRITARSGIDLWQVKRSIERLTESPQGAERFIGALFSPRITTKSDMEFMELLEFLDFRVRLVTSFVQEAARLIHGAGREVGLDCFTPSLAYMVGQDLGKLDSCGDWVKIMSYGHVFAPAGIPFELVGMSDWLKQKGTSEFDAAALLAGLTGLPLPVDRDELQVNGLSPESLRREALRARDEGAGKLLAGIELVDIEGVTNLSEVQIKADVEAFREVGVDGLALSWDLWRIPLERLTLVGETWGN